MPEENEFDPEKILQVFNRNNIKYVIIGGQAALALGSAYTSFDIGFCYSRDEKNIENIVNALKPIHPYLRGADKDLPFIFDAKTLKNGLNFTFSTDIGDIDILGEVTGLGDYDNVLKYSEPLEIYGMMCNVLTLEGLIKSKKAAGRKKDLNLIEELKALVEIKKQEKK